MTVAPVRVDPPFTDGERAALAAWLDLHRATLLVKCAGLTPEQLGERPLPPSGLSLRGLLRHMTDVERYWFARVVAGRDVPTHYWAAAEDADFDGVGADGDVPATAVPAELAAFTAEVGASRATAAGHASLDDVSAGLRHGERVSLRWVLLHMIEEYARHNGHADLLRERIDGTTGC
ncbi:DinB family protein [uncultured Modestobacter sp.]|uniref:DinB family protein n=1 Tax=uncultured Modestobacter sp. TaxID=380048 RepID=UPI002618C901|nr:DinB family protein [uncultured Modestobacter sp.]